MAGKLLEKPEGGLEEAVRAVLTYIRNRTIMGEYKSDFGYIVSGMC